MRTLYERFLKPGDLVFDIGANVGARTQFFLDMGCRVVSVEPQPECAAQINTRATIIVAAAGAEPGRQLFYPAAGGRLSTLSLEYIQAANYPVEYGTPYEVKIVTLDELIAAYGVPDFLKIDVEGGEVGVLQGLSCPVRALSFEMHTVELQKMHDCVRELSRLGFYDLSFSDGESFVMTGFPPGPGMTWGDVYAVLR